MPTLFWVFGGYAGRAGLPGGLDVLTRSKGRACGLDAHAPLADNANNMDLLDDPVWKTVEARLAGLRHLCGHFRVGCVVSTYPGRPLARVETKVRMGTLTAVRTAQENVGRPWLPVTPTRQADQPLFLHIPEVAAAYGPRLQVVQTSEPAAP